MLTDTHCHLDLNKFDGDRDSVVQRAIDAGLTRILIPALELDSSRAAIQLAKAHPIIFAAVGFHPTDLDQWDGTEKQSLIEILNAKVKGDEARYLKLQQRHERLRAEFIRLGS